MTVNTNYGFLRKKLCITLVLACAGRLFEHGNMYDRDAKLPPKINKSVIDNLGHTCYYGN